LLVWLSKKTSHLDPVELKTDVQTINMVSASATTATRRLQDADSYAGNLTKNIGILVKISDQSVKKQKMYAIMNDRLETFDRYCTLLINPAMICE
jgi:hypothetical protein